MGRELDVARSALLASTVFAGGVALPLHAYATPANIFQLLGAADGAVISAASGGYLGVFNSGGLGASSAGGAGPVAVFIDNISTGAATLVVASSTNGSVAAVIGGAVVIGDAASGTTTSAVISSGAKLDISGGVLEFAHSSFLAIANHGGSAQVVSGGSVSAGVLSGGTILISSGQTALNAFDSSGGVVLSANLTSADLLVGNAATVIDSLVSSGLTSAGLSSHIIDVTVNGSGIGTGVGGVTVSHGIGTGKQQFILIDVTTELTQALTLSAENASDYFFVYLTSGLGSGGVITTGSADGVTPNASHIITIIGDTTTSGTQIYGTQQGTFIYDGGAAGGTLTVNGTINGGIFLANTSTNASELLLNGGSLIQANPWNGYFVAASNEPASLAGLATGAVALGALRRRKRRMSP